MGFVGGGGGGAFLVAEEGEPEYEGGEAADEEGVLPRAPRAPVREGAPAARPVAFDDDAELRLGVRPAVVKIRAVAEIGMRQMLCQ